MPLTAAQLAEESSHATELLRGKVVSHVDRQRETEALVEFADGSRLFVDGSQEGIELSITSGTASPRQVTVQQAYLAMFAFLESQFQSTESGDIGALLGALSLMSDGSPADPAHQREWAAAIEAALAGRVKPGFGAGS